jgi:uncharacterized protein (TIGR00162 family)
MNNLFKLYARPELKSPNMIAAWPGIGNVSTLVAQYLEKKLVCEKLGIIEASHFFDPIGIVVKNNVVEAPQFPRSEFYYWKNPGEGNDLIIFIGEDQPTSKGYELANCILDVGLSFGVNRVYTCAAALTRIHHAEQPDVWGVASNQKLIDYLNEYNLIQRGNLQIAGLNGLLLGVAKERDIDAICLLGEVPMYANQIPNPVAALSVLGVLTKILGIEIDIIEMEQMAIETKGRMKQLAAEAMEEYIDLFTEPIWEKEEEEED